MSELLQIQDVTKRFGGLNALTRVSLSVHEGESVGLIGPNGVARHHSTISGMRPNSDGYSWGEDITGLKSHEICHRGIARTFQLVRPFLELSPGQCNLCLIFGRRKRKNRVGGG
jgi:branched-chain amino acid transport system ATP-binding protein